MQISIAALFFGATISYCVAKFSGGDGLIYQSIATLITIISIILADSCVVYFCWDNLMANSRINEMRPSFFNLVHSEVLYDPFIYLFLILSVVGGLFILEKPGSD